MPNFENYKLTKDSEIMSDHDLSEQALYINDPTLQLASVSNQASYIKTKFDTPDLFSNRFDTYFTYFEEDGSSRSDGLLSFVKRIYGFSFDNIYTIMSHVADIDSLAVRCSGISLPGYTMDTATIDTRGWSVDLPTGIVNLAGKSSISFRLDKHAALTDLFSAMSGKLDTINLYDINTGDSIPYRPLFAPNLWQKLQSPTTEYNASSLGLCLIVLINPMKRFPILGSPADYGRQYAYQTMMGEDVTPLYQDERYYRWSKGGVDYDNYLQRFPIYVFENIKIVGVESDLTLTAAKDPGTPPETTISFIYRRFRQINLQTEQDLRSSGDNLGSRLIK